MTHRVQNSTKQTSAANPKVGFYVSVALAVSLILGGLLTLSLMDKPQSSNYGTTEPPNASAPQAITAPDFTLQTPEGHQVKLSDYQGQVILLNTWATWCPPCRAEMPALEAYYREHKDDGFVVLAVNSQESVSTVTAFITAEGFTFPVLLDPDGAVMSSYGVRSLPTSFFIDRDGTVRRVWNGQLPPAKLKEIVDPLL